MRRRDRHRIYLAMALTVVITVLSAFLGRPDPVDTPTTSCDLMQVHQNGACP